MKKSTKARTPAIPTRPRRTAVSRAAKTGAPAATGTAPRARKVAGPRGARAATAPRTESAASFTGGTELAARPAAPAQAPGGPARPNARDIAVRAYFRYLERGTGGGMELDDWLQAERDLRG